MPKVLSAVRALLFGSAGSQAVAVGVSGDTNPRLRIDAGGRLTWGTGAGAGDIYVERSGVNSLLVSGELLSDSYQVDVTATPTGDVAKLIWDDTDGTLLLGLKGGNVTLSIGEGSVQRVSNVSGSNMARAKVVRLSGAQGNRTTIELATASTEAGSSKTFGVTAEAINNNASGFVMTEGLLKNFDTSALTEGSIVWLSTTSGEMTTTRPGAPNHGVMVGLCVKSHASTGILLVKVQNGYELDELHNVSITSPTNGQVLTYDAALAIWKNANSTGGGASVSVGDTAPVSPSTGDLWFNSTELKTYIYYDSFWVEVGGGSGGSSSSITVADTAPSNPSTGNLWFDSSSGRTFIFYDTYWVEARSTSALTVSSHSSSHVRGGSDITDGDRLQIDYVPTRYTRNSGASGAGANTDLTAHLSGIDTLAGQGHQVLTTAQKNALTNVTTGTMVYDSTLSMLQVWNGAEWRPAVGLVPIVPSGVFITNHQTTSGIGTAVATTTATQLMNATSGTLNAIRLDGVFSSAFIHYRIMCGFQIEELSAGMLIRLTTNGVPNTTANYSYHREMTAFSATNGATTARNFTTNRSQTSFEGGWTGTNSPAYGGSGQTIIEIAQPFSSTRRTVIQMSQMVGYYSGEPSYWTEAHGLHQTTTSFDGIYIWSTQAGIRMNGDITVYGYSG